ncbi:hypothetical protein ACGF5O_37670 [Streptomyces sp. NPDC048291]|uniref:hypothetical protein n=1 Tax=Streptomyces sp. NPDC048291 TaxID=3365530 RepID=UPI003716EE58
MVPATADAAASAWHTVARAGFARAGRSGAFHSPEARRSTPRTRRTGRGPRGPALLGAFGPVPGPADFAAAEPGGPDPLARPTTRTHRPDVLETGHGRAPISRRLRPVRTTTW